MLRLRGIAFFYKGIAFGHLLRLPFVISVKRLGFVYPFPRRDGGIEMANIMLDFDWAWPIYFFVCELCTSGS